MHTGGGQLETVDPASCPSAGKVEQVLKLGGPETDMGAATMHSPDPGTVGLRDGVLLRSRRFTLEDCIGKQGVQCGEGCGFPNTTARDVGAGKSPTFDTGAG